MKGSKSSEYCSRVYALNSRRSRCSKQTQSLIEGSIGNLRTDRDLRNESNNFLLHPGRNSALGEKIIYFEFRGEDFDSLGFKNCRSGTTVISHACVRIERKMNPDSASLYLGQHRSSIHMIRPDTI